MSSLTGSGSFVDQTIVTLIVHHLSAEQFWTRHLQYLPCSLNVIPYSDSDLRTVLICEVGHRVVVFGNAHRLIYARVLRRGRETTRPIVAIRIVVTPERPPATYTQYLLLSRIDWKAAGGGLEVVLHFLDIQRADNSAVYSMNLALVHIRPSTWTPTSKSKTSFNLQPST